MEKLKKYQKAVLKVLNYYAAIKSPFMPDVENKVIIDTKNHHYQLQRIGWYQDSHVHYTVFHFEIQQNKIVVHENRTDVNIDAELIDVGIAPQDIISGLEQPALKTNIETAMA